MPRYHGATVAISLLALALAGCSKSSRDMSATSPGPGASGLPALPAALPMQAGPASQPATAPPVAALPVRRLVAVARPANERAAYAYLDRASDIEDEIGDAPPDYDYRSDDGVTPWVWQTHFGDYRYAEPVDGGYRYYYYQPGARYPYLVRSRDYSYAYAGDALVAVYAPNGALLPPERYDGYRDQASRYYWRGQQLRQASQQRPHQGVVAANWAAQRARFGEAQAHWDANRAQQPDWQAYHAQNDPSQQPGWQQEHQQRQQAAQQFSGWQSRGLSGPAPAVLAAAGALAVAGHAAAVHARQPAGITPDRRPPAVIAQPAMPGPQGFAGRDTHRHDMSARGVAPAAGPVHNQDATAAAAHEQQLAAQKAAHSQEEGKARQAIAARQQAAAAHQQQLTARKEAQQQMLAGQKAGQEANRARQQATAAREQQLTARKEAQQVLASQKAGQEANHARQQAAVQQQVAGVHHQQERAAQQQVAAHQQAQQHEALNAAHQAQLHALAAQRQVEPQRPKPQPPKPQPAEARHEPAHPAPDHEKDHRQP